MKSFSDRTTIDESHSTKFNFKLKTHSLTSLETSSVGFHRIENSRRCPLTSIVDENREKNSFKIADSLFRLRRNGNYRSSLQTVNNLSDRPARPASIIDRSIPKFSLRPLPSLIDVRRDESEKPVRSSWEKSRSWSWKSILRPPTKRCETSAKTKIKSSLPHSISNYEVSSNILSIDSKIRYPSTPLLSEIRADRFLFSPLAKFDEEEEEEDSMSIDESTFRSCLDSLHDSSTLSQSFTDELTSEYDEIHLETFDNRIKKRIRSSFCLLQ